MVSLRQIRSFVAVFEQASFTGAAEREGATQSGISQHVKQLEDELGVQLFERHGRHVEATAAGRNYYNGCVIALRSLDTARHSIGEAPLSGQVHIGLMPTFTRAILKPALEKFLELAPNVEISVIEAYSGVLTESTLRGDIDFAIVPAFEGTEGLSQQLIARDREVLVKARGKASDHLRPVRLADLPPLKLVLPRAQNTRRTRIDTYCNSNGVSIRARLEMDAMMGTLQFVAGSDWATILPFVMMMSDLDGNRFEIRPLDDPPFYSDFVLIEPQRKVMTPAAKLFAELLKSESMKSEEIFRQRIKPLTKPRR